MLVLHFTPVEALLGGFCLGVATVGRLAITGRLNGTSGIIKGYVFGSTSLWRLVCISGVLLGGLLAKWLHPSAFDDLPASYTLTRAAVGGLLVGFGSSLGNGCTMGHGICGLGRLSIRSLANVACFMVCGALAATLTGTAEALGITSQPASLQWPSSEVLRCGVALVATAVTGQLMVADMGRFSPSHSYAMEMATELISSLTYALGVTMAGMVRPSKVAAFLSITHAAWDPSLMCVMGGALLLAIPGIHWISSRMSTPILGAKFGVAQATSIDWPLLLGGCIFGAGWGITGMCPCPALVALVGNYSPQVGAFCLAVLLGMWLDGRVALAQAMMAQAQAAKAD
jgi:uncharacterized membrane protein YedE/YeeE